MLPYPTLPCPTYLPIYHLASPLPSRPPECSPSLRLALAAFTLLSSPCHHPLSPFPTACSAPLSLSHVFPSLIPPTPPTTSLPLTPEPVSPLSFSIPHHHFLRINVLSRSALQPRTPPKQLTATCQVLHVPLPASALGPAPILPPRFPLKHCPPALSPATAHNLQNPDPHPCTTPIPPLFPAPACPRFSPAPIHALQSLDILIAPPHPPSFPCTTLFNPLSPAALLPPIFPCPPRSPGPPLCTHPHPPAPWPASQHRCKSCHTAQA